MVKEKGMKEKAVDQRIILKEIDQSNEQALEETVQDLVKLINNLNCLKKYGIGIDEYLICDLEMNQEVLLNRICYQMKKRYKIEEELEAEFLKELITV